jgi:glycerol-3-phosphate dehydrogenase
VVGGGIFGICSAWDASLRGMSVAIIEKHDFAHGASSNHFKMVHGGIRYIQHGDVPRIRESSRERSALLRIAPHLVKPLPIVIPTYGYGIKGKLFLGTGVFIYDLLTLDRNKGIKSDRSIPWGRYITKKDILGLFPQLQQDKLTGGVIFCDGQVYNPPRLAISFLRSAVERDAQAANYCEAKGFIKENGRVIGVRATDRMNGEEFNIRGKWVLNTTGAWAQNLLEKNLSVQLNPRLTFSRDLAFVVNRKMDHEYALTFSTHTRDADAIIDIGGRRLFAVPWRDYTLIGVWHKIHVGIPETIGVTVEEMTDIVQEVNDAYPGLNIVLEDIQMVNMGLTLFGGEDKQGKNDLSFGKRSRLIDHKKEHGVDGITTLIGVRATTARRMAAKAINLISIELAGKMKRSETEYTPIFGGDMDHFNEYLNRECSTLSKTMAPRVCQALICNYGTKYKEVLKYVNEDGVWKNPLGNSTTLEAEVVHSVREEMAQKLTDVVFRRTDLGTGGYRDEQAIKRAADVMGKEMGWDDTHLEIELDEVIRAYPRFGSHK